MFKNFIESATNGFTTLKVNTNTISLYPISEYNLEAIKILIDNCSMSNQENHNVRLATIDTSLWLGDFLDKYWDRISYVCTVPKFEVLKFEGNEIVTKPYDVRNETFNNESELELFFNDGRWKKFVIYKIVKFADLSTMKTFYTIRYADITEKYEIRDNKINLVLDDTKSPNLLGDEDWLDEPVKKQN